MIEYSFKMTVRIYLKHAGLMKYSHIQKSFLFLWAALLSLVPFYVQAQVPETAAKQLILIDYDTDTIMMQKNPDEKMATSSMSKVMTIYMVFDALKKGNIKLEDEFLVSEKAWRMQGSKMFVPINEKIKVEDLIRGVIIQSGNDATIVLAEGLAGSEEAFAAAMNKKAAELGMVNSHFMNASGWPDPEHYSTARDLAILSKHMVQDFPEYYGYFAEKEFTYHDIKQGNRNPLLYKNLGADGLKTGHTEDGGYGMMATAVANGRRVILVINGLKNMQERADETSRLVQWGQTGFKNVTIFKNFETTPLEKVPVIMGDVTEVPVNASKPIIVTLPNMAVGDFKVEVTYKSPLVAPVKKGQEVGVVTVHIPNSDPVTQPLLAGADVGEMNYALKMIVKARMLSTGGKPDIY